MHTDSKTEPIKIEKFKRNIRVRFKNTSFAVFPLTFLMTVFAVIDMFIANSGEFFFGLGDILPFSFLIFFFFSALFFLVSFLLPNKLFKYYLALLYAVTFCFFIQGNILRTNFGLLNGEEIIWSNYIPSQVLSFFVWISVIIFLIILVSKNSKKTIKVCRYLSLAIVLIEMVALLSVFFQHKQETAKEAYLSQKNEFTVSKDRNTIVFLLDAFDAEIMNELLSSETNKVLYDVETEFKDFTFYNNVVAGATRTKYAIPFIFTGVTNKEPVSYIKYIKTKYPASVFIKTLKKNDVDSAVFTNSNFFDLGLGSIINNIVTEKRKVSSKLGLTLHFFKLIAFRYSPTPLKRFFWMYTGDFDTWQKEGIEEDKPYVLNDFLFFNSLKNKGLSLNNSSNSFRFIHLMGPHAPYTINENVEKVKIGETGLYNQAIASLKIVKTYLNELKKLGVYENSTIFIMADHGLSTLKAASGKNIEQNPLMMIKEANSNKDFSIDDVSLHYKDLVKIFSSSVCGERLNIEKYECRNLDRLFYTNNAALNLNELVEYKIIGDASKKDVIKTGVVYYGDSKGFDNKYKLGKDLSFRLEATGNKYVKSGFSVNEGSFTWTSGKRAELEFDIQGKYKDLLLEIEYGVANNNQHVILYVNDNYVEEWTANKLEKRQIIIPGELVDKNKKMTLAFVLPLADSPKNLGRSGDSRLLALSFRSLRISSVDKKKYQIGSSKKYETGSKLSFKESADSLSAKEYIKSGFSHSESWGTWTDGKVAKLSFSLTNFKNISENLVLNFDCRVYDSPNEITLFANGTEIYKFNQGGKHRVQIPKKIITQNGVLNLVFYIPGAVSPSKKGNSTDKRELGVGLISMVISEESVKAVSSLENGNNDAINGLSVQGSFSSGVGSGVLENDKDLVISNSLVCFLSTIFNFCYNLSGRNYLLALLLFTLLTKIVLLPVSVWSQKNSNKLASLQADINNLKASAYGNRDYIADETAALYKKAHYNPFLSTVPMLIQIAMLLLVINVVKRPDLAGLSAADMRFWRIDLTKYPYQANIKYLVMPLLAGLSAFALGAFQNKFNPLQSVQSKSSQKSTNVVSIGISLILGAFVAVAVGFYWVFSNLLTIFQQLLLNVLVPPKGVDKKAVSESRERLEKVESLKKKNKLTPEQKAKEKADYKRFFRVANKHIVFYSESNGFYKYMEGLIEWLLAHTNLTIHYVTSDSNDSIFKRAAENPRIRAYFIGPVKLITLFMKMDAEMVVMTMTDLGNYHLKRSYVKKDVEYVYIPHYPLSTHLIFHTGSFDNYDTIFCVGDFQKAEIREYESLHNLKEKNLVSTGYYQLEKLHESYKRSLESGAGANAADRKRKILVAPSWQAGNILDSCIDDILASLLGKGYQVIVRPHPEYVKRYGERLQSLIDRYSDYKGGDLIFETDFTSNESIFTSDILISDWSGIAYEYAFVTGRPPVFVNTPMKVNNPAYKELTAVPKEISLRGEVGRSVEPANVSGIDGIVAELLENEDEFIENNLKIRDTLVANFGHSSEASGRYIIGSLKKKKEKKAENSV